MIPNFYNGITHHFPMESPTISPFLVKLSMNCWIAQVGGIQFKFPSLRPYVQLGDMEGSPQG